ncbi:alpha/beta hydrolase [Pseudonocardia sp. D17]|uniref:alpha/beta hydrolase n=1 Tax=Pseudonocardia sp. D17 TaxID=882661 RepID=UPI002B3D3907|nr:esterase [Pseudonocardia sp. D17]
MTRTHPPFDPELEAALRLVHQVNPPTVTSERIADLRAITDAYRIAEESLAGIDVAEHVAPGPAGAPDVALTVLRPADADPAVPLPGMLHIHGGGMVAGNRRVGLDWAADWLRAVPMVVASVEYRLAPEHPHPAPLEDCYAGLEWLAGKAAELGVDPSRLVVAGGSAGGGLAAGVALLARDRGGPALAAQLLICPMIDDRARTPSSTELDGEGLWDRTSNATGWAALLGDAAGGPDVSPYAAPARATSLAGLPPAFLDAGAVETFRDETVDYATRLWQAGGQAELHVWPGAFHGFDSVVPTATLSREARAARENWLRRVLSG